MSSESFYSLLFRQKYIARWGLMRSTRTETLSEHSMETAVLAHALAVIGNDVFGASYDADRAAVLGLFHDAPEVLTGDLPTPVKYASAELRQSYAKIEETAAQRLLSALPDELRPTYEPLLRPGKAESAPPEARLVKAADKLDALLKCLDERAAGNHEFDSALTATYESLRQLGCPELDWFMDRLLPSFSLTLDEAAGEKKRPPEGGEEKPH